MDRVPQDKRNRQACQLVITFPEDGGSSSITNSRIFLGICAGANVILVAINPLALAIRTHPFPRYPLQTMHEKITTEKLRLGMFVADLDRPWIDTPFLLQGFLLEDDEQLQQVRLHCQWVTIDPYRSVGPGFDTPAKKATYTAPVREPVDRPRVVVQRTSNPAAPAQGVPPLAAA